MPRANESGNRMKTAVAHCCIVIIKLNFFRRKHDYQCMECFHPVTFPIWQYPNLVCVIIHISARQKNKLCHTVLPTIYFPFPNQLTSIIRNLKILDKLTSYYSYKSLQSSKKSYRWWKSMLCILYSLYYSGIWNQI